MCGSDPFRITTAEMQSALHRFNSPPEWLHALIPGIDGNQGLNGAPELIRGDATPAAAAEILTPAVLASMKQRANDAGEPRRRPLAPADGESVSVRGPRHFHREAASVDTAGDRRTSLNQGNHHRNVLSRQFAAEARKHTICSTRGAFGTAGLHTRKGWRRRRRSWRRDWCRSVGRSGHRCRGHGHTGGHWRRITSATDCQGKGHRDQGGTHDQGTRLCCQATETILHSTSSIFRCKPRRYRLRNECYCVAVRGTALVFASVSTSFSHSAMSGRSLRAMS